VPITLPPTGAGQRRALVVWSVIVSVIVVAMGVVLGYVAYTWVTGQTATLGSAATFSAFDSLTVYRTPTATTPNVEVRTYPPGSANWCRCKVRRIRPSFASVAMPSIQVFLRRRNGLISVRTTTDSSIPWRRSNKRPSCPAARLRDGCWKRVLRPVESCKTPAQSAP